MKTNLLKTAGLLAGCVRYFFYFTIALYTIFTLAGLGGDSFVIGSWEYTFNKPIDQISVWLILLTTGLILVVLVALSHIAYLIQKLCKLFLEEDYFASASLELYQKLFISLLVLTAGQFCLTSLIALTNAAGANNFLNLRWSDFILNALFIFLTYFVWTLVQKGQQLETENSEFI
ncbi:hypothetical protein HO483_05185 [Streptococcus suis]|uniref:DUF2975 domain-containing protein n=1 Tax=Streptococcus suis TaxID=1307 RepID=A0A6L8MV58_STRSU|nr:MULTISPECIES: hypothetical protein [Streptococcus]MBY4972787.1 hypothetical protein [Streptococcus suis]MBY5009918.1 hypothetical protein [Streptococcus suis]MDG4477600.1 hypothetical protein [Streptococcus parasuis]MDG4518347.1 hypothetical protein [Streptococcus suis]MYN69023.1 hypothetical protein [Streptococcus suis]